MPDYKLNIIGTFNNKQLVKALRQAGVDVKNLGKKTDETNKKMGAFRQATAGLRRTMGAVRNNILLVTFALGGVGVALKKTTAMFAEFEKINIGFKNLGESVGLSENALQTLTDATDGTVNSMELMRQANNAMLLGIVESEEQMGEMFDVAQRLASALGKDTLFGIESLTTGIGRQCLTSDSFISTKEGMKQITYIEDGDIVLSCNDDGEIIETRVTHLHDNGVQPVYIVTFKDGKYIKSTGNHRYLTEDGWKCLDDLGPGANVISIDNGYSEIYSIDSFGEEQVYDLTVPETANFFANGLCVHNSRLMLDNLGIIVKSDDAYKAYAKTLKKTVSELTEQERKTAFINAAMTAAREKVQALGDEQLTTKDAFNQTTTSIGEMSIEMGEFFAPAAVKASIGIKKAADGLGEFFRQLSESSLETAVRQLLEMGSAAEDIALLQNLVDIETHTTALLENNKKIKEVIEGTGLIQSNLSDKQLKALGAEIKLEKNSRANMEISGLAQKRIIELKDVELVTQEKIGEEMQKLHDSNIALNQEYVKTGELNDNAVNSNSIQMIALAEILTLVKQRENAERVLFGIEEDRIKLKLLAGKDVDDKEIEKLDFIRPKYDTYLGQLKKVPILQEDINKVLEKEKKLRLSVLESAVKYGMESTNAGKAAEAAARGVIEKWIQKAVAVQFEKALETSLLPPPFNLALAAAFAAAASSSITGLLSEIKFSAKGADFVTSGPQMMMVGDNPGGGREHVQVTPLSSPNLEGPQGGGANITVNVSGNVMTQDYVEGELAEQIKEAIRRGEDFGIS